MIDFQSLAIEARRLGRTRYAVGAFALLINMNLKNPTATVESVLQSEDAKPLSEMCNIVVRRFSRNTSEDFNVLISLLRFGEPPLVGQQFMLIALLALKERNLDERTLDSLFAVAPDFFKTFLMSRVYANPVSFCPSPQRAVLPLQIPSLQFLKDSGCSNSILKYLVQLPVQLSFEAVRECLRSEDLFSLFIEFVYTTPTFFIFADHIIPDENDLNLVFTRLAEIDKLRLIRAFLMSVREVGTNVLGHFQRVVSDDELIRVTGEHVEMQMAACYYFALTRRIDLLEAASKENIEAVYSVLRSLYEQRRDFYIQLLEQEQSELLVLAIKNMALSALMGSKFNESSTGGIIGVLLNHDVFVRIVLEEAPHFFRMDERKPSAGREQNPLWDVLYGFYQRHQDLVAIEQIFRPDSVLFQLLDYDAGKFIGMFSGERLVIIAREILMGVFAEGSGVKMPGYTFFEVLASNGCLEEAVEPVFSTHGEVIRRSGSFKGSITRVPELLIFAIEFFRDDQDFVRNALTSFHYNKLEKDRFVFIMGYFIHTPELMCIFDLSLQVSLCEILMNHVLGDADRDFLIFALEFFMSLKGRELFSFMDEHTKDLIYSNILDPLVVLPDAPMDQIYDLMLAISGCDDDALDPDLSVAAPTAMESPPVSMRTEAIEPWIHVICEEFRVDEAEIDHLRKVCNVVQLAILNTELGFIPPVLEECRNFFEKLQDKTDIILLPEFVSGLYHRLNALAGNAENADIYTALSRVMEAVQNLRIPMRRCLAEMLSKAPLS